MPTLDVAMPTALLVVVLVALFLNKRVEGKLVATVEQKEFKTRDILLLVAFIVVMVSVIAYTSLINAGGVFENVLLVMFLSSYTVLLFTFSFVFAKLTRIRAQLLSIVFGSISLVAALASLFGTLTDAYTIYRVAAFAVLAVFCFGAAIYEQLRKVVKQRWYVAAQPPALFVLLFVLFRIVYAGQTMVWYPVLLDIFGLTFAILIILYLSSMFSWKTVGIFAVLLTIIDMVLVFGGPMTQAAGTFTDLGLPVLVYLPNVPLMVAKEGALDFFGFGVRGLGLGDFFFAGILAIQTFKKFGKKTALTSVVAMVVAFGIWEAFLPELIALLSPIFYPIAGKALSGFPGTLMIISGWIPIVAIKLFFNRKKAKNMSVPSSNVSEGIPSMANPP
ncbi:MAG TPA: hypothetical protein VLH35_07790 [Candidatus Acidoferrales bacterium]|nr:hypothetical protein [Candidatus Acidoferrales bacterium]